MFTIDQLSVFQHSLLFFADESIVPQDSIVKISQSQIDYRRYFYELSYGMRASRFTSVDEYRYDLYDSQPFYFTNSKKMTEWLMQHNAYEYYTVDYHLRKTFKQWIVGIFP